MLISASAATWVPAPRPAPGAARSPRPTSYLAYLRARRPASARINISLIITRQARDGRRQGYASSQQPATSTAQARPQQINEYKAIIAISASPKSFASH